MVRKRFPCSVGRSLADIFKRRCFIDEIWVRTGFILDTKMYLSYFPFSQLMASLNQVMQQLTLLLYLYTSGSAVMRFNDFFSEEKINQEKNVVQWPKPGSDVVELLILGVPPSSSSSTEVASLVCVQKCANSWVFLVNFLSQMSHWKGFSPVWVLIWCTIDVEEMHFSAQIRQVKTWGDVFTYRFVCSSCVRGLPTASSTLSSANNWVLSLLHFKCQIFLI